MVKASNETATNPESYQLCKTDAEIQFLQELYGLIEVTSTPTKAAMHPGWPETLSSIVFAVYTMFIAFATSPTDASLSFFVLIGPVLIDIAWTTTFAFIEIDKHTGGWISVVDGSISALLMAWAAEDENHLLFWLFALFGSFQGTASFAVVIQRWKQQVGSIAYLITDNNGCTPLNGFQYLQQGARSRAFKIIQTVEWVYSGYVIIAVLIGAAAGDVGSRHTKLKAIAGIGLMIIWIPVVVYEGIIATKGRPVVISGNCMLVELDPRWGFFDSEIVVWWKFLVGFAGL